MSFVNVAVDAAKDAVAALESIGSGLNTARTAASGPTAGIAAAAQDEVSAAVAKLFGDFGREYQAVSAQAQAFHEAFARLLGASAGQYASAEAVGQSLLGPLIPLPGSGPFAYNVIDYPTPVGNINLTLYGETTLPNVYSFTSGTLNVPTPLALAFDTLSPFAGAGLSLRDSGAAFDRAMQIGNYTGATTALVQSPFNAVGTFFFGGQAITGSTEVNPLTGYTAIDYRVPVGGLFSPVSPASVTLHGTGGTSTLIPLSGTQFGGPFAGIAHEIGRAIGVV